jgi:ubiquinone biosynthesis protein
VNYTRIGQNTVNAVRLAEVVQVLVRHGFADVLQRVGFHDGLVARALRGLRLIEEPQGEPATFGERLRAALTELGPTFVKFGQILSTRPDLVGQSLARELSSLQDQVTPLPFETMHKVISDALGGTVDKHFASFHRQPVASASLSQVYRATLPSGEDVAVKVLRPGIEKIIESDLRLMRMLAQLAYDHIDEARWLDPPGIVEEFARSTRRELDLAIEARIIERFRANFAEIDYVFIPKTYPRYSSRTVLTMDWVDGVRVDCFDAYAARSSDRSEVARLGCEALCLMFFEHHLFHADPHPGNILLTRDNVLAFIDFGMAGHLNRADVGAVADLFLAIFHQDAKECVDAVLALTVDSVPTDRDALEHEVTEFIAFEAESIISSGQVARGIEAATDILYRHGLQLAPRFSMLLKSLATIEIVGRSLDPALDFLPILEPHVRRLITERYQPTHLLKEAQHNAGALVKLGKQIPNDISNLLGQLRRGRFTMHLEHEKIEELANAIDRSSNRNALALIVAALIVGSSVIVSFESTLGRLGTTMFALAGLLGLYLVFSILWSRKF